MYEFSITGALAFSGAYLVALRKYDLRWLGLLVSIAVLPLTISLSRAVLSGASGPSLIPLLGKTGKLQMFFGALFALALAIQ